jgi:hypothetical protein
MSSLAADVVVAVSQTQVASCIRRVRTQPNLDRNCNDSISNESSAYLLSSGRLQIAAGAALCFSRISEINAGLISQKGVLHHRLSKARQLDRLTVPKPREAKSNVRKCHSQADNRSHPRDRGLQSQAAVNS